MKRPLTTEQRAALRAAATTLPNWKALVRKIWARPEIYASSDTACALYSLRNTHGPSWLASVKTSEVLA